MNLRPLLPTSLALALCACTTEAPSAGATAGATAGAAAKPDPAPKTAPAPEDSPAPAAPVVADGSLDFHFTSREVGVNSKGDHKSAQCQLKFTAANNSKAPVKSVMAEFRVTRTSDGSVIDATSTLVMPFAIPPGETKESWGDTTFDSLRCADIQIALLQPDKFAMCRTTDESPCPVYRLTGEGVAIVP